MANQRTAVEYGIVLAIVLAIQAISFATQDRIAVNDGRGYDGGNYYESAEDLAAGERPDGPARFVRRIGTPLLVALIGGSDVIAGFQIVNASAAVASSLLFAAWLRRYVDTSWLRIALVAVYATHWLQLVRFTTFYPVLVDACAQVCCFAGLHILASYEQAPRRWKVAAVTAITIAGVCFREVVLIVPVAFLFVRNPAVQWTDRWPRVRLANLPRFEQWLPIVLGLATVAAIDRFVIATDSGFTASDHLITRALGRSGLSYVLGWMVAFGPGIFLVVFDWRRALAFLGQHRWMLAYVAGVAAIGWAGSLESERHAVNWASPIVFVLIGRAVEHRSRALKRAVVLAVVVVATMLVNRVFWPTPQPADDYESREVSVILTPVGSGVTYLHLFPHYMPQEMARAQLLQHAAAGILILLLLALTVERAAAQRSLGIAMARAAAAASAVRHAGLQLRSLRTLKVLIAAFILLGSVSAAIALVLQPARPIRIHVRWTADVDASQRSALEQTLGLSQGRWTEATTWAYVLPDPSTDRIRAIVTHSQVDDTAYVNRTWYRPEFAADRERRAIAYGALAGALGAIVLLLMRYPAAGNPGP